MLLSFSGVQGVGRGNRIVSGGLGKLCLPEKILLHPCRMKQVSSLNLLLRFFWSKIGYSLMCRRCRWQHLPWTHEAWTMGRRALFQVMVKLGTNLNHRRCLCLLSGIILGTLTPTCPQANPQRQMGLPGTVTLNAPAHVGPFTVALMSWTAQTQEWEIHINQLIAGLFFIGSFTVNHGS